MTDGLDKLQQQRIERLETLRQMGIDPYGKRIDGIELSGDIRKRFVEEAPDQKAKAAGRIVLLRDIGKLIFIRARFKSG